MSTRSEQRTLVKSDDTGCELIVGPPNHLPKTSGDKEGCRIHLKMVSGAKVVKGWFMAEEVIDAVDRWKKEEEKRVK